MSNSDCYYNKVHLHESQLVFIKWIIIDVTFDIFTKLLNKAETEIHD